MNNEIWKPIKNFETIFEVSNTGKVRNIQKNIILKQRQNSSGFWYVSLYKNGNECKIVTHRLVANAFIKNNNKNKNNIRHIDGIRSNNNFTNLEYVTTYIRKKNIETNDNYTDLIWKDIKGYEDIYKVSNSGLIKSISSNIILKPILYLGLQYVVLCKNNKITNKKIHRIVGETFLAQDNIKTFVIKHIGEDRTNNNIINLELIGKNKDNKQKNVRIDENGKFKITEINGRTKSINEINRYNKKITNRISIIDNDTNSIWKDIIGYEELYKISNKGEVYSYKSNKIIKQIKSSIYWTIKLTNNKGKRNNFFVHRLVAFAFIPQIENKNFVNHKDRNGGNNCIENLEWVNTSENNKHAKNTKIFETCDRKILENFDEKYNNEELYDINFLDIDNKKYKITKDGKIYSYVTKRFLKPHYHNGYKIICMQINKKSVSFMIHRLIALSFIEKPDNKDFVNHKDGNKENNNINNLEWVTHAENIQHAVQIGLIKTKNIIQFNKEFKFVKKYNSIKDAIENYKNLEPYISKPTPYLNCYWLYEEDCIKTENNLYIISEEKMKQLKKKKIVKTKDKIQQYNTTNILIKEYKNVDEAIKINHYDWNTIKKSLENEKKQHMDFIGNMLNKIILFVSSI
jgi:hypothetical protein